MVYYFNRYDFFLKSINIQKENYSDISDIIQS